MLKGVYSPTETVSDRVVLELGSGTGLIGILTAQIQLFATPLTHASVILTDCRGDVLERCQSNVGLECSEPI